VNKVHDKRLLKLIGRYLRAGVMVDGLLQPSAEGTMQGGVGGVPGNRAPIPIDLLCRL